VCGTQVVALQAEAKRLARHAPAREPLTTPNGTARTPAAGAATAAATVADAAGISVPTSTDEGEVAALRTQLDAAHADKARLLHALSLASGALDAPADTATAASTAAASTAASTASSTAAASTAASITASTATASTAAAPMVKRATGAKAAASTNDAAATVRALVSALERSRASGEAAARRLSVQQQENVLLHSEVNLYKRSSRALQGP
jgi:hypothetical protein